MLFLRLALVPALLVTASQAADPLQQTLAKMEGASATFKGLTADFKRVNYTAVIDERDESSGTIVVRRAKPKDLEMKMVVKEPEPRQLAFSGHTAQQYNPKTNIDDVYPVDKKYDAAVNEYMLLGFGSSPKDLEGVFSIAFGGAETIGGRAATRIELTPLKPDTLMHLVKAELWISDETGIAVRQKLNTEGGNYILATYSNMRINPNISPSDVKLNLPGNAKTEYPLK
jgi:outer membrane lipoprotein-sorting protein